jgi:hypothetical protein
MARNVYSINAPGSSPPASRAKSYTGRYSAQRWENWSLALKQAEMEMKLDEADTAARQKLALQMHRAKADALKQARKDLAEYRAGIIDENQLRERFNVSERNDARAAATTTFTNSTSTSTGTAGDADAPVHVFNNAGVRNKAFRAMNAESTALANQIVAGITIDPANADASVREALRQYETTVAPSDSLTTDQKALARFAMLEGLVDKIAASQPGAVTPDMVRSALFTSTDPTLSRAAVGAYTTANEVGEGDPITPASSSQTGTSGTRITQGATARTPYRAEEVGAAQEDPDVVQQMENAISRLAQDLATLEIPLAERKSLIEEARNVYRREFGLDRRLPDVAGDSFASRPSAVGEVKQPAARITPKPEVRAALERGGFLTPVAPAQPTPITFTRPSGARELAPTLEGIRLFMDGASSPASSSSPDLAAVEEEEVDAEITRPRIAPSAAASGANELDAVQEGIRLYMEDRSAFEARKSDPDFRAVVELYNQRGDKKPTELVLPVIRAYKEDGLEAQKKAVQLLFGLDAEALNNDRMVE